MATESGFYLLRLVLFLHIWSAFYSAKQVKFIEETRSISRLLVHKYFVYFCGISIQTAFREEKKKRRGKATEKYFC